MKKTFLEVMAGENVLKLSHSQKRVLKKVLDAGNPKLAAQQIIQSPDSRNLVEATKELLKYGYVATMPPVLGYDDEPDTVELTEIGQEAAEEYDIQNDESLLKPEEREAPQPEAPPVGGEAGGEAELSLEEPGTELGGEGVGLELSSFFRNVNDLARLKSILKS